MKEINKHFFKGSKRKGENHFKMIKSHENEIRKRNNNPETMCKQLCMKPT